MGRAMMLCLRVFPAVFLLFLVDGCASDISEEKLQRAEPEEVGMSSLRLGLVKPLLEEAVAAGQVPGAVLLVGRQGKIGFWEAFGLAQVVPSEKKMEKETVFDLASITKPVATATSIMILVEEGKLRLSDKVKDFVPEFEAYTDDKGNKAEDARIWHLLTHTSGLPAYTDAAEAAKKLGEPVTTAVLVEYIAGLPKSGPPGRNFTYSCLGFITLGFIVEKAGGMSLRDFSVSKIFKPLWMDKTMFLPGEELLSDIAPTQVVNGRPLCGVVHDPLARLQGGISGNAGLFSNASDLAVFAWTMLREGEFGGARILSPLSVRLMTGVFDKVSFGGCGLGWDLASPYSSSGGDLFPSGSYGHTGYTGTSIWIDPMTDTFVILLTNRVHPDDKGEVTRLRSLVANVVAASIVSPLPDRK